MNIQVIKGGEGCEDITLTLDGEKLGYGIKWDGLDNDFTEHGEEHYLVSLNWGDPSDNWYETKFYCQYQDVAQLALGWVKTNNTENEVSK